MADTIHAVDRRLQRGAIALLFVFLAPLSVAACAHGSTTTAPATGSTGAAHATMAATMPGSDHASTMPAAPDSAVVEAAWQSRPAFTNVSARTAEAYRYALEHPYTIKWMPCYCGCGAMDHRSNLDCYIKPSSGSAVRFEEHASYCDICVDITLKAKQLIASGQSLAQVRAAIDAEFGGTGPSTDTERPAA